MSITREGSTLSFDVEARIAELPLEAMIETTPADWGPTPLGLLSDSHVIESQAQFYGHELPDRARPYEVGAPAAVIEMLHDAIDGVRERRGLGNGLSYSLATEPIEAPSYFEDLRAAAFKGQANALGQFVLGHLLDMPSIELGKITFDGHLWPKLRGEVKAAFSFINPDAEWVADTLDKEPRFGLAAITDQGKLQAMTVRARKYRGDLTPRARVREVVNFLLRIDPESGFDQDVAAQLQESRDPDSAILKDFYEKLRHSIASDVEAIPDWAIPLTSTIYAYDPTWQERHPKPTDIAPDTEIWVEHLEQIRADEQKRLELRELRRANGWFL